MGVDRNKLASIIGGKARQLCSPENDAKIQKMAQSGEYRFINENNTHRELNYDGNNISNSRMPEHIKQSMMSEVIDMGTTLDGSLSVLDTMNIPSLTQPKVMEQKQNINTYTQPQLQSNIDYTIIKAIINECLKEYFDSRQALNESTTLQTIGLQNGNISLVDNKGNIFRAKLEKIGNKNDKK